jgi:polyisoprenoid-binding protein YceI
MNLNRLVARKNGSRILCLVAFCILPSAIPAQVPVYEVTPVESSIKFGVDSSVPIRGIFDKWTASMKFSSTDVRSGVLEIEIQADSVNTGNGLKNNKLKSKDFFDVKDSPTITFRSTKVVQTGPNTFDLETLRFAESRKSKNSLLRITARDQPPEASTARWPSIARTTG